MSEPFIGEIRMFAGNFAPRGWALCDGQLLAVTQNDALFSLFGTIYGGDGRTTFGLPDLRSRIPIHMGSGPGLTPRTIGQKIGSETAVVQGNEVPVHSHTVRAAPGAADSELPAGRMFAVTESQEPIYRDDDPDSDMDGSVLRPNVGGQPHANIMPYQTINYVIALVGIYPSRT